MTPRSRPSVMGTRFAISTTHYLATEAGMQVFRSGGNAVDAGVAAGVTLGVVDKHYVELGGVAPTIVHGPGLPAPEVYDGIGRSPIALTLPGYRERLGNGMPAWLLNGVVPGALDTWLTVLEKHGRLPLSEVLSPAIDIASEGFPVHRKLARAIDEAAVRHAAGGPEINPRMLAADGTPLVEGELLVQPELASFLRELARECKGAEASRRRGIALARESFYRGRLSEVVVRHWEGIGSTLKADDLYMHRATVSSPVRVDVGSRQLGVCGPWSQGPTLAILMQLLKRLCRDLPDDPALAHAYLEAMKLAAADREGFIGDPEHVEVPLSGLCSDEYADERVRLVAATAAHDLPPPGRAWYYENGSARRGHVPQLSPASRDDTPSKDTGYVCAMDVEGYSLSATPSDGGVQGPTVEDLGLVLSRRGEQFWLEEGHPAGLARAKRPRLTPNPAILMESDSAVMALGTPGADAQCQAMAQVLVNVVHLEMGLQEAIEAPRVVSAGIPESAQPHRYRPGVALLENRHPPELFSWLEGRGHIIEPIEAYDPVAGGVSAVRRLPTGALEAAADPRRDGCAMAW